MKISLRLDQLDSHAHFAVFIGGGKAGDLCVRADEWRDLCALLERGAQECGHAFVINDCARSSSR